MTPFHENKELRILLLEDAPADVILIEHELRQAGLSFQVRRVETREAFLRELDQNPPDIILSDHGLPSFDGFAALEVARKQRPDVPFIFVTGSMGEELAIDSLRGGATDYVLKNRISNLVPALQRALRLADERTKRKQAENELRDSEERFRLLVSGVKDYAICMLDPDGRISSWNAGAELVLGRRAREAMGQHFGCFYRATERDTGKPEHDLEIAAEQGRFEEENWRVRGGDAPFWAHVDIRALRDDSGALRGFTQVTRDVTERMRAQEELRKSEERYRRLVELCPDALMVLHRGEIAFVNTAAQRLLGANEPDQLLGRAFLDFIHAEGRDSVAARLQQLAARESRTPWVEPGPSAAPTAFVAETIVRLDGGEVPVEVGATRMTFQNEPAIQIILHDVSTQRRAAAALRESEARKTAVLETSLDAIVGIDHAGIVREWNSAAEKIFGYRRDQALGSRLEALIIPSNSTQKYLPGLADYLMTGAGSLLGRPIEVMARRANGEEFPIELALTQVPIGDSPFFTAFMRDITDRKRAEDALRRSEARKSVILETALDAVVTLDDQGKIIEWNPAAEKVFGYSRELALGRTFSELMTPAANEELARKGLARYLQSGRGRLLGQRLELMALRANGASFPVELTITHIAGEGPMVFTSFIRDITDRRRTEEALRKSEERFRLLVEGVEDYAIYMLDTHGRVTTWNAGAERIHGYRAQEIVGRRFHRFYTPEDGDRRKPDQALAVATSEGRYQDEHWLVRKNGAPFWASFVITALRDESGKLTGFSTIARDVTKRKNAEDEIRRLNSALERQVQERTAELQAAYQEMETFSYSISHDLRAPLIHIAGFVEMLKGDIGPKLDERSRRHLETICHSAEHMGRMIADLSTLSRLGRADLHKVRLNVGDIVKDVQRELAAGLQDRTVRWNVGELPEAYVDPVLLRQVFVNLLSNALKFTRPRAEAEIEIGTRPDDTEDIIYVRDNGVGFDLKYASKLFGVFQRLHSASEFEGTGTGLASSRRIIQRHGGRIWAESTPDAGATFYFSLPRENAARP
jgi:PAS domain S-box-containing protein